MTQTTDAALVERLRDEARDLQKAAWGRSDGGQDCSISSMLADEAADTIEAQGRRIEALEGALANVRYEAERENGGLVHLKRAISVATRTALEPTP